MNFIKCILSSLLFCFLVSACGSHGPLVMPPNSSSEAKPLSNLPSANY